MTKRYYITDPMQAAMAARDFGMWFSREDDKNRVYSHIYINAEFYADGTTIYKCLPKRPLYLHERSEHLLQPQVGDVCQHYSTYVFTVDRITTNDDGELIVWWEVGSETDFEKFSDVKIIQRNGKPFPQFESEVL